MVLTNGLQFQYLSSSVMLFADYRISLFLKTPLFIIGSTLLGAKYTTIEVEGSAQGQADKFCHFACNINIAMIVLLSNYFY